MSLPIDMKRFAQIKSAGELPSPRGVALAVIRMTQSSTVSLADLGRTIKADPALVGRLIKAANGMFHEGRRPIVSVQEALMVLGLPAVRGLALGFSLLSSYRKGACKGFDYTQFWSSSLLMGLSMQMLTLRLRVVSPDEAFSLGLLARVGELGLASAYPDAFARILGELRANPGLQQGRLEDQAFAIDHCELGAAMLLDWGVPESLAHPVRYYEQPDLSGFAEGSRESGIVQCLVLSRAIARLCLLPEAEHEALMPAVLRLASRLGLPREELVAICERIGRSWGEWGRLLQMNTGACPRFEALGKVEETTQACASPDSAQDAREVRDGLGGQDAVPRPRALVLVRDEAVRKLLRTGLNELGMMMSEAPDAESALEQALDVQPQVLVVEWDEAAARLVRSLRDLRMGRSILVLAVVVSEDDAMLVSASAAGADDFLVQPLGHAALMLRLRNCLRTVALQRDLEREREELRSHAAELAISNRRLHEAALTDALTGLPNRRHAGEALRMEWSKSVRHARPLSVMVVDLDNFKSINDTHGHDIGDIALRLAAEAVRKALRVQDVVCRTGGDEFLVLCLDADLPAACAMAQRVCESVRATVLASDMPKLNLSVSVGVAERTVDMSTPEALVQCADRGAIRAKQHGRDRVVAPQRERQPAAATQV